jgi:hypothetical protein
MWRKGIREGLKILFSKESASSSLAIGTYIISLQAQ